MSCSLCSENGGHFKPKYGGHFDRFFHSKQLALCRGQKTPSEVRVLYGF